MERGRKGEGVVRVFVGCNAPRRVRPVWRNVRVGYAPCDVPSVVTRQRWWKLTDITRGRKVSYLALLEREGGIRKDDGRVYPADPHRLPNIKIHLVAVVEIPLQGEMSRSDKGVMAKP